MLAYCVSAVFTCPSHSALSFIAFALYLLVLCHCSCAALLWNLYIIPSRVPIPIPSPCTKTFYPFLLLRKPKRRTLPLADPIFFSPPEANTGLYIPLFHLKQGFRGRVRSEEELGFTYFRASSILLEVCLCILLVHLLCRQFDFFFHEKRPGGWEIYTLVKNKCNCGTLCSGCEIR